MTRIHKSQVSRHELEKQLEELRNSNEALKKSRDKYAFLYDVAPVGYLTLDGSGYIQTVNLTGARLLGMERSSLTGLRFEQFVAAEDRAAFADFLQLVFVCRDKKTYRLKLANVDGPTLYVRMDMKATASGEECHAALLDITERKRSEEALQESEYNLSKAQAMSHVGSWRSDPITGDLGVSDELLRIMRLDRDEVTQEMFTALIHPEDIDNVMRHLQRGIEQGSNYEIEHRLLLRDGTVKWVNTIVEPSVYLAKQVVRLYGTTQDITERKQAEVSLRNKTNEFQAIFDAVNDGVIVFEHNCSIQHFNHICPQFFTPEVLSGGGCKDIFHPELASSPDNCPVEMAMRGERVETIQVSVREGQKTRYMDITATPIKDALGEKNRVLVFFRDISEKRLQEMHLIQAEKMSSIGVLATGIAHEINNPLSSVAGYAEALLRRFRDEPVLKEDARLEVFPNYLEVIVRESYRCKGIIDNLLSFSRKSDGSAVAVDMNAILVEIIELLRHQPSYRQVKVHTYLKQDLPQILGDPSGLRQVCMNLLVNAHQSIKDEDGLVELTTDSQNGTMVTIKIRDNGCGIAQETIERIWDPFFTTKEVGKGVGLGLALTYNIVKRHGGEIRVESRIGEGSQFTVILPVQRE